ncbi:hypothetical protein D3C78_1506690 [compost metagenome]
MVPGRGIVEYQQGAGIRHGNPAEFFIHGGLAVHGVAQRTFLQGHPRQTILALTGQQKLRRSASGFTAVEMGLKPHRDGAVSRNAGDFRIEREGAAECGVVAAAMVALAVIFPDELPVAFLNDGGRISDLGV